MERSEAVKIQKEIAAAVEAIYAKHGLTARGNSVTWSDTEYKITLKAVVVDETGHKVVSDRDEAYAKWALVGYKNVPEHIIGSKLKTGATIIEFKSANKKYPFIIEQNGKRYKVAADYVASNLGLESR